MQINAEKMQKIGKSIKAQIPGKGFALVVFDFGEGLREFQYLSNGQREDMINTFEALLIKWKNENPKHN